MHVHWCKEEYRWVVHEYKDCELSRIVDKCSSCCITELLGYLEEA